MTTTDMQKLYELASVWEVATRQKSVEYVANMLCHRKLSLLLERVEHKHEGIKPLSICTYLDMASAPHFKLSRWLRLHAEHWPEYSGNPNYPVPGGVNYKGMSCSPGYAYTCCSADKDLWYHPQFEEHCKARVQYLKFLVKATLERAEKL